MIQEEVASQGTWGTKMASTVNSSGGFGQSRVRIVSINCLLLSSMLIVYRSQVTSLCKGRSALSILESLLVPTSTLLWEVEEALPSTFHLPLVVVLKLWQTLQL